jgi:hypothetical protein
MEVKVRAAMQGNFATLTSVPDHVAFVATTSEYQIKNLLTLADLKDAIKENGVCDNPWIFPFCKLLTWCDRPFSARSGLSATLTH